MKCAIVLSGHLRGYDKTYESLKSNILDKYDCDLFCSTWDNQDEFLNVRKENKYIIENTSYNIPGNKRYKDLNPDISCFSMYEPKYKEIYNYEDYIPNSLETRIMELGTNITEETYWILFNMENILKQWYMIKKGSSEFLENIFDYDCVFRIRFDSMIENLPEELDLNVLNIMPACKEYPAYLPAQYKNDTFAYGPPKFMKLYLEYYDYLKDYIFTSAKELLVSDWGDGAPMKFKAEYMFGSYLLNNDVEIEERNDIKIKHHIYPNT